MKITVENGDVDKEECLLQTPRWDLNWQRGYFYDGDQDLPGPQSHHAMQL